MSSEKSRLLLATTFAFFFVLGLFAAGPLYAQTAFVSAGGPYEADVGEEIEFDASLSAMSDGSAISGYYWDWNADGLWDECFTLPKAKHTWHSAYSDTVRVFVFHAGGVDWADAKVTVEGPETSVVITVNSTAALRLGDGSGHYVGENPDTGLLDMDIAGATLTLVPPTVSLSKEAPIEAYDMQYAIPLVNGPDYKLTLTGAKTGAVELRVQGIQDDECCSDQFLASDISEGEQITVALSACCKDGALTVACGPLCYCPGLETDPDDKVELNVQPGGRYETTITIRETEGYRDLEAVVLTCSELTGETYTIPVSDVSFSENGFDVPAGGEKKVIMAVDVPENYLGEVTGTLTVSCAASDEGEEIDVIVTKAGTHAPMIEVVSPVYGVVGNPVEFDATGSIDIDGEIDKYCWDWNLTGAYECVDGPVVSHTWNSALSNVVGLRVVDDEGNASQTYVQVVITE